MVFNQAIMIHTYSHVFDIMDNCSMYFVDMYMCAYPSQQALLKIIIYVHVYPNNFSVV